MKKIFFILLTTIWCASPLLGQDIDSTDYDEKDVQTLAETMPKFPGGMGSLSLFLAEHIEYPNTARFHGISGTVLIEFVVDENGQVCHPKVKVPLFKDCDSAALRGIMAMPKWKPAMNNGKPVRCDFQIPITFRMDDKDAEKYHHNYSTPNKTYSN